MTWHERLTSVVALVVILLLIELGARVWERGLEDGPRLAVAADLVHVDPTDARWVDVDGGVQEQRGFALVHAQRFEAQAPEGTLRVVWLGGSSVFNLGDRLHAWGQQVGDAWGARDVEVWNLGVNAHGSRMAEALAAQIRPYAPDVWVVYTGHNDWIEALQRVVQGEQVAGGFGGHSALLRAVDRRRRAVWMRTVEPPRVEDPAASERVVFAHGAEPGVAAPREAIQAAFGPAAAVLREGQTSEGFTMRLRSIVRQGHEAGAVVVLATVPSNLWRPVVLVDPDRRAEVDPRLAELYAAGRYAEGMALAQALLAPGPRWQASALENAAIRQVAEQEGAVLADVEAAILAAEPHGVPGETLFDDWCHLNDAGNGILLAVVADAVRGAAPGATKP